MPSIYVIHQVDFITAAGLLPPAQLHSAVVRVDVLQSADYGGGGSLHARIIKEQMISSGRESRTGPALRRQLLYFLGIKTCEEIVIP